MVFSALFSSSPLRCVTSALVACPLLLVPSSVIPSLGLTKYLFSRCHSENRESLARKFVFSSTSVLYAELFLTSGSSTGILSRSPGRWGHSLSCNHKKFGPVIQRHCRDNSWPSRPPEVCSVWFLLDTGRGLSRLESSERLWRQKLENASFRYVCTLTWLCCLSSSACC